MPVPLLAGAPTIDGVQGAPEWDGASATAVSFGTGLDGTLYVGRDANNLYVALKVTDANGTTPSSALYFDNNDDGTRAVGDDLWDLTGAGAARDWFVADVSPGGFGVQQDALASGTNDTTAAQSFGNGVYFAEYKHPLCANDPGHDICVTVPAQVGFVVLYAPDGQTGSEWPAADLFQVGAWANLTFGATDGRIVYDEMVSGVTDVFSANPDGTQARQLTNQAGRDEGAQYSPDGKHIVWGSDGGSATQSMHIWVMNADGSGKTQLTSDSAVEDSTPTYSPDGTKIAFARTNDSGDSDIWVMDANGANAHDITNTTDAEEHQPAWSPDGKKIAYASGFLLPTGQEDIVVANADGTSAQHLTNNPSIDNHDPAWSPDGTKIAYVAAFNTATNQATTWPQVLVMDANGANKQTISDTASTANFSADPSWSPDGTRIAFSFSPGGIDSFDIWAMNPDGTNRTQITHNSVYDGFPNWGTEALDRAASSTASTPSATTVNALAHETVNDKATVTPEGIATIPTGTVTFFACGPLTSASGCSEGGQQLGDPVTLDGSGGPVTSSEFAPTFGGTYCFRAEYSGNAIFAPSSDGSSGECFSVTGRQPGPAYTVNTASDLPDSTGCTTVNCSLHEAIDAANAAGVPAVIDFLILTGPQTINMNQPLPTVTVPLTIDGTSQPGGIPGQPPIALDATGIEIVQGENQDGLVLKAGGDSVSGLAFENFPGNGIVVDGGSLNTITGNVVGMTADGESARTNGGAGILVRGSKASQLRGNLVSANGGPGILVTGGSSATVIRQNMIGTDGGGNVNDVGNAGAGIEIDAGSPGTVVGGTGSTDGNRIASNHEAGVEVGSSNNSILGNSIDFNRGGGIDLGTTGNQLQAAPTITQTVLTNNSLTMTGRLVSPGDTYRLEFFLSTDCGGAPEGATFIHSISLVVGALGQAGWKATVDISDFPNAGDYLTATATSSTGNTSAFSGCVSLNPGSSTGSTISLTPSPQRTTPGASVVPTADIPPSAFAGSTDTGGGTASSPLGAIPLGAIPLGAIPLGAIPLGAIPLGAIGLTPQALVQDGLGGVPLNSIPLNPPKSWDTELQSTAFAGLPTQTLTLRDVLSLNPLPLDLQPDAAHPITLRDVNLSLSPLGAIPLGAIALGSTPLGAIPIGGTSADNATNWCTQIRSLPGFSAFDCTNLGAQTVAGLALQGVPLGAIPLGAIPLGAIPLGAIPLGAIPLGAIAVAGTPLGAIPLGAITLAGTPLGAIPLGAIPLGAIPLGAIPLGAIPVLSAVVDCTVTTGGFSCTAPGTTLADALTAGAIKSSAKLQDLGTYANAVLSDLASYLAAHPEIRLEDVVQGLPPGVTLQDLLASLTGGAPASWEQFPLSGLQAFAGKANAQGGLVSYSANFSIAGDGGDAVATVSAALASGAFYVPGSSVLTDNTGTPVATKLPDPAGSTNLTWSLPALNFGDSYTLTFKVRPGFELGTETTTVTLKTNGNTTPQSASANITVDDTFESNNSPQQAPPIAPSTLYVSYLGNGKDVDYSTVHIDPNSAPPGTRVKIFLSHLTSDDDLAVFGPVDAPLRSAPLGAIPLGAIATGDQPVQLGEASQPLSADTAQDLPFGVLPAGDQLLGVSDNRGTADEEVDFTSTGQTGDLLIQVSSYDGHPTTDPYVIRVEEDLPPALPPCTQTAPTGTVPSEAALPTNASIPSTAQTLILFNEQRLGQYYTATDAHTVYTKLVTYAARSDVRGVIVPVEKDTNVAAAYTAWNGALCSPAAANGVVRAIGHLLDALQANHPNLKTIVIVGADTVIPMARLSDQTQQANELGFQSNFGFVNNEYVGAVAAGDLLSDDPYADPDPQAFIGGFLYVPKLSLGRLVEKPADISQQLDAYTTNNGLVNPQTKLVTGYDFLTDGSQAVNTALGRTAPNPNQINDTWTADQVRGELFPTTGAQPLIDSLNAHYDQHRALSAQGNTLHNETDPFLFTSTNISAKGASGVLGRIVFTMGCHAGFSLFDNLNYGATASSDFTLDWPQAYMEGGAIEFMGNTGFGLGDTATVGYSERLNQLFAARLNGTMTMGEALEFAKQEYFGDLGVVSLYDAKVGNEATLYGIPTYRLGTGTPPAAPTPAPTHTDSATNLTAQDFNVAPSFTLQSPTLGTTSLGNYFTAGDPNGLGTQVTNRRPIEPLTSFDVSEPNTIAHGILITSLVSHNVPGNFHAAFSRVADDSSSIEPQLQGVVDFPASIQSIATVATPNGQQQRAVLIAGHFASGSSSGVGTQRLYDQIGGTVLYSTSSDFTRPTIRNVQITQIGSSTVGFAADVSDLDASGGAGSISEAIVLYLDGNTWRRANLTCANGRCTGGGPVNGSQIDYIVEAVDAAGNVGVNANKAATANVAPPSGSTHITLTITGATQVNGWYTAAVTARLASDTNASLSFSLDGGDYQDGSSLQVTTDGLHTLDARASDGSTASFVIPVDVNKPTIRLSRPLNGQTYLSTDTADYSCFDAGSGIAANGCVGTVANGAPLPPTNGVATFTVTATDNVGRTTSVSVTYTVWQWAGFFSPVDNPPTINVVKAGSGVPVKFSLGGNRGLTFLKTGYPASQQVACSSGAPQDDIEQTVTAGGSSLQFDPSTNQYTYIWKTDKSWAGTCRDLTLLFPSGSVKTARFKFS